MKWMLMPLKRYADFTGRSRRKEFWMFFLFQLLVTIAFFVLMVLVTLIGADETASTAGGTGIMYPLLIIIAFWALFWLAMLVPNAALIVRRFHDQNISGVVGILLYIGTFILTLPGIVLLIFMGFDGKKGANQYGDDPKIGRNIGDVFL